MKKAFISILLCVCFVMVTFTGCGGDKIVKILVYPQDIFENAESENVSVEPYRNVRLFVDNTWGVRGFTCADSGKASGYLALVEQLVDTMNKYKSKEFFYLTDVGSKAVWTSADEKDFVSKYKTAGFYNVENPLTNPFSDGDAKIENGLNIYITDLAEGADENKAMAEAINANIIAGKNRSALLYSFLVPYVGTKYRDKANTVDANGKTIQDEKELSLDNMPVYMVVSGYTEEIKQFQKDLLNLFADSTYPFEENKNYFCCEFLSGRGLKTGEMTVRTEDFVLTSEQVKTEKLGNYFIYPNTDLNFDVELKNDVDVFPEEHKSIRGLFFQANSDFAQNLSGDEQDARRFSFVIDLPVMISGDNGNEGVDYELELDAVYYANDDTVVPQEENPDATEATDNEKTEENAEEVEKNADGTVVYDEYFTRMSDEDAFDLLGENNANRLITLTCQKMEEDTVIDRIHKDVEPENEKINRTITVSPNENGSYLVTVDMNCGDEVQEKYDSLIFTFKLTASVPSDTNIPDWIKRYDSASAKKAGKYNQDTCADDLVYIYNFLNGTMASEELKQKYNDFMKATVDVLPVMVDFRSVQR